MRRLDHLCCETCYQFSLICTSMICGLYMQWSTSEVLYLYVLAYFVAKKGEKNSISILSICLFVCIYFTVIWYCTCFCMPVFSVVAFILQLFQVLCRSWHSCCNILMFLMMIWESVLSIFLLYMFTRMLKHVCETCVDVKSNDATSWCCPEKLFFSVFLLYMFLADAIKNWNMYVWPW